MGQKSKTLIEVTILININFIYNIFKFIKYDVIDNWTLLLKHICLFLDHWSSVFPVYKSSRSSRLSQINYISPIHVSPAPKRWINRTRDFLPKLPVTEMWHLSMCFRRSITLYLPLSVKGNYLCINRPCAKIPYYGLFYNQLLHGKSLTTIVRHGWAKLMIHIIKKKSLPSALKRKSYIERVSYFCCIKWKQKKSGEAQGRNLVRK